VTVAFGVPVKVTVAEVPPQMLDDDALIAAVGGGKTVIVTEPEADCVQPGAPAVATLTSVMVVVDE
jgi:hypothetical protein